MEESARISIETSTWAAKIYLTIPIHVGESPEHLKEYLTGILRAANCACEEVKVPMHWAVGADRQPVPHP